MNNNYKYYTNKPLYSNYNVNDQRLAGGFVFPFLLGGVTGAAIAPAFWNNNNRPYYVQPPYYPPYYVPYVGPRRWF